MWPFTSKIDKGIKMLAAGKTDEAIGLFGGMVEKDSSDLDARVHLAKAFFKKGDLRAAKEQLLAALDQADFLDDGLQNLILEMVNHRTIASSQYYNGEPAFPPNSRWIVFTSARQDTNADGRVNNLDNRALYLVDPRGRSERCLVPDTFFSTSPNFSPDGKKIVFLSRRRDTNNDGLMNYMDSPGIYTIDVETGDERRLVTDEWVNRHPVFSPDGRSVIFCSQKSSTTKGGIFSVDCETGEVAAIVPDVYESTFPSLSPDGKLLVYSTWRVDTNKDGKIDYHDRSAIYLKDIKNNIDRPFVEDGYDNAFPNWSPDGRHICFLSRRRDTNKDGRIDSLDNFGIYQVDAETKKVQQLVPDDNFNKYPSYHPDGRRIMFQGNWRRKYRLEGAEVRDRFEYKGLYLSGIKDGKLQQLVSGKYWSCADPVISKTGKIAYTAFRKGTRRGLQIMDPDMPPDAADLIVYTKQNL